MGWRDELEVKKPGTGSTIDRWVESLPDADMIEFVELVADREVNTSTLFRVAKSHGMPTQLAQFGRWRHEQWDSAKI